MTAALAHNIYFTFPNKVYLIWFIKNNRYDEKWVSVVTYLKWSSANASLYKSPSRRRRPSSGGRCSPSPPSSAPSSITGSSGMFRFLILHMLCNIAQTSIIWQTFAGGQTLISLWSTWNRLFNWPMPLSTTLRVFLCDLYKNMIGQILHIWYSISSHFSFSFQ